MLLLFYSTLMSLAPIRVVHPGTDLLQRLHLGGTVSGYSAEFQPCYNKKSTNHS